MPDTGLERLYRLHKIDHQLHDLKAHAAALDTGQEEAARLKEYLAETDEVRGRAKQLASDLKDLELEVESLNTKKKKFENQLFDGSITNSREAENVEREIEMLKELIDGAEMRELELMETLPSVQEAARGHEDRIGEMQKTILGKRKRAVQEHEELKKQYAETAKKRPAALQGIPEPLLKQYEVLRAKLDGVAMAIVSDDARCGECGMHVPERALEQIRRDQVVQCEQCRRILFSPIPIL